jgi:hypothetical protein
MENESLKEVIRREKVGNDLKELAKKAERSDADRIAARDAYQKLKSRYPDLFRSPTGVRQGVDSGGDSDKG